MVDSVFWGARPLWGGSPIRWKIGRDVFNRTRSSRKLPLFNDFQKMVYNVS